MKARNIFLSAKAEPYCGLSHSQLYEALGALGARVLETGPRSDADEAPDRFAIHRELNLRQLLNTGSVDLAVIEMSGFRDGLPDVVEALQAKVPAMVGIYAGKLTVALSALQQEIAERGGQLDLVSYQNRADLQQALDEQY